MLGTATTIVRVPKTYCNSSSCFALLRVANAVADVFYSYVVPVSGKDRMATSSTSHCCGDRLGHTTSQQHYGPLEPSMVPNQSPLLIPTHVLNIAPSDSVSVGAVQRALSGPCAGPSTRPPGRVKISARDAETME